jgi:uncharacterized protein
VGVFGEEGGDSLLMFLVGIFIRGYQLLISPILRVISGPGGGCRFEPTCSHYFLGACKVHGLWRGGWLGLRRLGRCHPWGGQGIDMVPTQLGVRGFDGGRGKSGRTF